MKIPTFHNNGNPFEHVTAQIFIEKPVRPSDSFIGNGYSIQLNTSNPYVELDKESNTWMPHNSNDIDEMLTFQQNVLQIGQSGRNNNILFWNRNAINNLNNTNTGVEYGVTRLANEIWEAFQDFGKKDWDCVHLEIDKKGMTIKLINNLKVIYEAKSLPQRFLTSTTLMDTPISPFTFFQVRIVGYGATSYSAFPEEASFGINIQCDDEFQFNLIDSNKTFEENWETYVIGGYRNPTHLYTGETSNLSCNLLDNNWRGKSLYYSSKVGL